ncbi:hypothetical protein [Capnocytophaga stomatis]|uniref:hypothetical protein n=1 Tax=Capnocytophaga stomatis TaxID=1848904 RepID=UPI001AD077D2|nr:hypothetical protein [Capnocytophaga stomatis]GIM49707.1 hypothetical protein CAPN003_11590 [Capnocytophaga stomatis]
MKKIYKEKYTHLWENGTWVVCPNCQKSAVIRHTGETFPNHSVLRCNHCGLVKKSGDLLLFNLIIKLNCPFCGNSIEIKQENIKEKQQFVPVKCKKCNHSLLVHPKYDPIFERINTDKVNGLMCDNTFGLPYFFQENVRGNLFWAKNDKHLLEIENYISSDLRPRKGMTMVAKLPTFIKIKKNKEIVLKILEKWKKSYK